MSTQHTPGPWEYRESIPQEPTVIARNNACRVAETCEMPGQDVDERRANARLIASAPELLSALQDLVADKYLADPINADRMASARAAIAKATNS